jgi:hypothetical protein
LILTGSDDRAKLPMRASTAALGVGAGDEDASAVDTGGLGVEELRLQAGFAEGVGCGNFEEVAGGLVKVVRTRSYVDAATTSSVQQDVIRAGTGDCERSPLRLR